MEQQRLQHQEQLQSAEHLQQHNLMKLLKQQQVHNGTYSAQLHGVCDTDPSRHSGAHIPPRTLSLPTRVAEMILKEMNTVEASIATPQGVSLPNRNWLPVVPLAGENTETNYITFSTFRDQLH